MYIELTEMLRCPEPHRDAFLVLSTSEMNGRLVWRGLVGCPVCQREFEILEGIVDFTRDALPGATSVRRTPPPDALDAVDAQALQALLDLSGPGGYVILLGSAARHAVSLAALMGGIHFVGINAPSDVGELPILSLLQTDRVIPLRTAMARGVVIGPELVTKGWLAEGVRVLLRGRRLVAEAEAVALPDGVRQLAAGQGLWVGEKQ